MDERDVARFPINRLFTMDIANNIWHIAPVPPGTLDHPAPFPEEIPYRLIPVYSYPGDVVLDPFVGSGQTTKVAKWLGRRFVGYDIIPEYVALATKRLDEPPAIRPQQLIATFEKIALEEPAGEVSQRARAESRAGNGTPTPQQPLFDLFGGGER